LNRDQREALEDEDRAVRMNRVAELEQRLDAYAKSHGVSMREVDALRARADAAAKTGDALVARVNALEGKRRAFDEYADRLNAKLDSLEASYSGVTDAIPIWAGKVSEFERRRAETDAKLDGYTAIVARMFDALSNVYKRLDAESGRAAFLDKERVATSAHLLEVARALEDHRSAPHLMADEVRVKTDDLTAWIQKAHAVGETVEALCAFAGVDAEALSAAFSVASKRAVAERARAALLEEASDRSDSGESVLLKNRVRALELESTDAEEQMQEQMRSLSRRVHQVAAEVGLEGRAVGRPTKAGGRRIDKRAVVALRTVGWSIPQIARAVGCTKQRVHQILKADAEREEGE
jgi:chromosome segregation ATPase